MPNLKASGLHGQPLLDIASYARRGPSRRDRLTPAQLELIQRTVRRTPEVMVKVLPKDSNNLRSVARHLNYIGRYGELGLETDDGDHIQGRSAGQQLLSEWDLDLEENRRESNLSAALGRAPKLVHKIMLSMPPSTPSNGVLAAARNFAREEFALKHRYALVLHTDEPHPHVHLVVKAVSERGVSANATERAVRGETRTHKVDGIYRAMRDPKRHSTHMERRAEEVADAMRAGRSRVEPGKVMLRATRNEVKRGWHAGNAGRRGRRPLLPPVSRVSSSRCRRPAPRGS
jgi:hypothetical protein